MQSCLRKPLCVALPLAGLLAMTTTAFARDPWKDSWEHDAIHREMDRRQDEFPQFPHSQNEHRRVHKQLKHDHKQMDRELRQSWNRERYDYERSYDEDPYDGRAPYDRSSSGQPPYSGNPYGDGGTPYYGGGYGSDPYYGGGSYPGPYALDPEVLIPSLLDSLLYGR